MGNSLAKTGLDRRYLSVKDIKQASFARDTTKKEAGIEPDRGSTIKIAAKKQKFSEKNPYESQIAARMVPEDEINTPKEQV